MEKVLDLEKIKMILLDTCNLRPKFGPSVRKWMDRYLHNLIISYNLCSTVLICCFILDSQTPCGDNI